MSDDYSLVSAKDALLSTGFTSEEITVLKNTIAKDTTNSELAYLLNVAKSVGLSPFNKEIWCYKDNKGNLLIFAGRDGFLKKAHESQLWNGITSAEVRTKDTFAIDIPSGKVEHGFNPMEDRGGIVGAYAIIRPKGCDLATVEWASFERYNKGSWVWKSHPEEMIKKVAETHALKKAFGITGLQSEYDFEVNNGVAMPIVDEPDIDKVKSKLIAGIDAYEGEEHDKETIKAMCLEKVRNDEFTEEFASDIAAQMGFKL